MGQNVAVVLWFYWHSCDFVNCAVLNRGYPATNIRVLLGVSRSLQHRCYYRHLLPCLRTLQHEMVRLRSLPLDKRLILGVRPNSKADSTGTEWSIQSNCNCNR